MTTLEVVFTPGALPPSAAGPSLWFVFRGDRLALKVREARPTPLTEPELAELGVALLRSHFLGCYGETACFSAEIPPDAPLPEGWQAVSLRQTFGMLDDSLFWIAARAIQIVDWDRTHLFCGRCGAATQRQPNEHVKLCPACGLTSYPRLAPAVIVAVEQGDRLLLAHNKRHPAGFHSVLAGFVEPGETLEQAVAREIREEVGLMVRDIRYFGSQPWPFPHSLMIAFTARYAGGELAFGDDEIETADWYAADNLPPVPPPISIARRLIDDFVARHSAPSAEAVHV